MAILLNFGKMKAKPEINLLMSHCVLPSIDHDCTTIGIMRNNNPNVTIAYIEELKNASNLLHFANLSPSNGVYFFNSHRKSTIQISHQVYFQNAGTDHLIDDQVY